MSDKSGNAWLVYGLLASVSIVSSEVGKVVLNRYYNAVGSETTLKELVCAGGVALLKYIQYTKAKQAEAASAAAGDAVATTSGGVPWIVMIAAAAWKVMWSVWKDECMNLAPNTGIAKNIINLNGVLSLFAGYLFLSQKINNNMLIGSAMVVVGSYISSLK